MKERQKATRKEDDLAIKLRYNKIRIWDELFSKNFKIWMNLV